MAQRRPGKKSGQRRRPRRRARPAAVEAPPAPEPAPNEPGLPAALQAALVRGLGAIAGNVSGRMAAAGGGVGLQIGKALLLSPEAGRMRREAGRYVRELRELAGLTVDELAEALEVSDHSLLAAVEKGTATLSFELILRLSSLLARNDPVPFIAKLTRTYNPVLWKLLESWGIGRIPLHLERERRFVNVYRARDAARELSDLAFDRVLAFTQAAFELALDLAAREEGISQPEGRKRTPRRRK
ncbi:MAG: transcriptional regulator [Proteobacteria bacterium]|nr:MAG: transcriptional regulator [Pseudomonadota bacterium]